MLWLKLFVLTLLVTALCTGALFLVLMPLLRRRKAIDMDGIERFHLLGFQTRTLSRKVFAYGEPRGIRVVASWQGQQLYLHAKVPGTSMLRIHATTYPIDRALGLHRVGPWYVMQGHESHIEDERVILQKIGPKATALLTDNTKFPEGVALRSGFFTFTYGAAAALILAGGEEELALSADLQTTLPFYVDDERVEEVIDDLARAAEMLGKDLAA